jgi:hypothetical protein
MVNIAMNPIQKSIGTRNCSLPPAIVAIQLKILTPVGMAIDIVETANAALAAGPRPVVNMWWAHTPQPIRPMAIPENTMKL